MRMSILKQSLEEAVNPYSVPSFFLPLLLLSVDESLADDYLKAEYRKSCKPYNIPHYFPASASAICGQIFCK